MKASQLAKLIGVDSRTIRRWTDAGDIPSVREKTKGGHYRYADTPALRDWIAKKKAEYANPQGVATLKDVRAMANTIVEDQKSNEQIIIETVNRMYLIGMAIQSVTGHEKLTAAFFDQNLKGNVPCSFDNLQICMSLARGMPGPAKTFGAAMPYMKKVFGKDAATLHIALAKIFTKPSA